MKNFAKTVTSSAGMAWLQRTLGTDREGVTKKNKSHTLQKTLQN